MEGLLSRLAVGISRRSRFVLAVWITLLVAGAYFAAHQQKYLSGGGWRLAGSQSARTADLLKRFNGYSASGLGVVVSGRSRQDVQARLATVATQLRGTPNLRVGPPALLGTGRAGLLPITYTVSDDSAIKIATDLRDRFVQTTPSTTTRVIGGPAIWSNVQETAKTQLEKGESIGFPLIFLILLIAFGTLVAALAPLVLGFIAVFFTAAIIYWISRVYNMSIFATNIASMIGIGISVDYSLFIVSRYRRELRLGADKVEALRRSLSTSGTAVVFSGATVAISLAGLLLVPFNAMQSMGIGAIVVVIVTIAAATTLLPAILSALGPKIEKGRVRLPGVDPTGAEEGGPFWTRWTNGVLKRPWVALVVGVAVMLALASPLFAIKTSTRGLILLPKNSEVRVATERVRSIVGAGSTGPVHLIISNGAASQEIRARLAGVPGIARVGPQEPSADHKLFLSEVFLASDPETVPAQKTLTRIENVARPIADRHHATVTVGGVTSLARDINGGINGNLWKLIIFIIGVTYVVLLLLLRSVLLPLKAVIANLLSVGAAYGVLVAVFQHGWLDWTGYNSPGFIDNIVPALVLAVTFGLSMDYEVFLLSRIRERYRATGDPETAVTEGVVASARIITSAAVIMVGVFCAFAVAGSIQLKELGFGLAIAVGLDATIVRLTIVPSAMKLMGSRAWWLPNQLDELLPAIEA